VLYDVHLRAVGLPGFVVEVSNVCSGFEGIGLMVAFLGGYILLYRKELRFPHVLLLLPMGIAAVWLANVARIVALILIGGFLSPSVAMGGFHSKAGWLFFCVIALGFIALSRGSSWFAVPTPQDAATDDEDDAAVAAEPEPVDASDNPTLPMLLPLLTLIAAALVTGLMTAGFDRLYGARIVAAAAVLFIFRRSYRELGWGLGWHAVAIGAGVFVLWIGLVPRSGESPIPGALEAMSGVEATSWVLFRVLGSALVVPMVEELAFRGYLLRRLQNRDFTQVPPDGFGALSLLTSSLAFGFLHSHWIAGTLAGAAYALAQRRRGRIADAVVAHAVTNGLICIDVLAFGSWSLW
jgi:exosortase E/protease (VPEID-CTERM system)